MYEGLVKSLQVCGRMTSIDDNCISYVNGCCEAFPDCAYALMDQAADAIEEILRAAKAMHTWIFLNSGDEQAAHDECGLTDEMNVALGYGGQFVVETPKEEK